MSQERKQDASESKKDKISEYDLFSAICVAITHGHPAKTSSGGAVFPKFPHRIHVCSSGMRNKDGSPSRRKVLLLENEHLRTVEEIDLGVMSSMIVKYCSGISQGTYRLINKRAIQCAQHFLDIVPPIPRPRLIGERSDTELCFHRLSFDLTPEDKLEERAQDFGCPLFYEFLSRCTNREAVCAFIGSLLEPDSDQSQYLWLYGEGRDGKSDLLKFIQWVFGPAYRSEVKGSNSDRFYTGFWRNKRVLAFPDFPEPSWPSESQWVKMVTGGDGVRMEVKGGGSWEEFVNAKLIFTSNQELQVESIKADTRRVIYSSVSPFDGEVDKNHLEVLKSEAGAIFDHCRLIYKRLAPQHQEIPVDEDAQSSVVEEFNNEMASILEQHFQMGDDYICTPTDLVSRYKLANTRVALAKFRRYLENMGFTTKSQWIPEYQQSRYVWSGFRPRRPQEVVFST